MFEDLIDQYGMIGGASQPQGKTATILDSADDDKASKKGGGKNRNSAVFQEQAIASEALSYLADWLETDDEDLDEGEGLGDRLRALMIALADDNKNGELDEEEKEIINIGVNAVAEYLISKGVKEENAISLMEDFDNALAGRVRDFLISKLPEGDDALFDEMDEIVFAGEPDEAILDDAVFFDAAYRKKVVIRNGKKMRVNKRISGVVKLSAKQKQALRKAQRKSHTGKAKMRRLKSMKMRKKMGV